MKRPSSHFITESHRHLTKSSRLAFRCEVMRSMYEGTQKHFLEAVPLIFSSLSYVTVDWKRLLPVQV